MTKGCLKSACKNPRIKKTEVRSINTMGKCNTSGWNLPTKSRKAASLSKLPGRKGTLKNKALNTKHKMIPHLFTDLKVYKDRGNVEYGLDIDYQPLIAKGEELEAEIFIKTLG